MFVIFIKVVIREKWKIHIGGFTMPPIVKPTIHTIQTQREGHRSIEVSEDDG